MSRGRIGRGSQSREDGLWNIDTGERLFSYQLHGPVIHLLLRDQKLYAATELGSPVQFNFRIFYIDSYDLMDGAW